MSLGLAAGLSSGVLSSGAALAPSTAGLLVPPPQAATRAEAPRAMAISVLRMGMYLACGRELRAGRPRAGAGVAVEGVAPSGTDTVGGVACRTHGMHPSPRIAPDSQTTCAAPAASRLIRRTGAPERLVYGVSRTLSPDANRGNSQPGGNSQPITWSAHR